MPWLLSALLAAAVSPDQVAAAVDATAQARSLRGSSPPSLDAQVYARAAEGEVVTGLQKVPDHPARKAWGVALIDAPIDTVWSAINDFSARTEHGALSYSEVQTGQHCGPERTVFQYLPVGVPMVSDRWWVVTLTINSAIAEATGGAMRELATSARGDLGRVRTDAARAMAAEGTPISFSEGGWLAVQVDEGHTLVEFHVWSDPGGSVPAGLASSFATGGVKDNFEALRAIIADGPRCP
jgi:hypothetical protein